MPFGINPSFNEPKTDDETSAPQVTVPTEASVAAVQNPIAQLLGKKKKGPKPPQALASAIAKSRKAYQSKRKYG